MLAKLIAWRGIIAISVLTALTLWLGYEGMLGFYIHPRYNLFTLSLSAAGILFVAIALVVREESHNREHAAHGTVGMVPALSFALVVAVSVLAIVVPPTTLSSYTADNRGYGTLSNTALTDVSDIQSQSSGFENLTVRDWASLLVQTQDPSFYRGKAVNVIGIVSPGENPNVWYLTRFVVTCCAVDAQPVRIPVYQPGWEKEIGTDSWVNVTGGFQTVPGLGAVGDLVVVPSAITPEEVPREPYLF